MVVSGERNGQEIGCGVWNTAGLLRQAQQLPISTRSSGFDSPRLVFFLCSFSYPSNRSTGMPGVDVLPSKCSRGSPLILFLMGSIHNKASIAAAA